MLYVAVGEQLLVYKMQPLSNLPSILLACQLKILTVVL